MATDITATVSATLASYAERGVFRGFGTRTLRSSGGTEYRFLWLTERAFVLELDPGRATLTFRDLLPGIPYRSAMDRALRRFLAERSRPELPPHRRIEPERLQIACRNRRGSVSITTRCLDGDWRHAVRKSVALANEIFFGFLRGPYEEYMIEYFHVPEE